MGKAENAITRTIVDYLRLHGALVVRVQSGMIRIGGRMIRMAEPGTADLVGVYNGYAIAVEVKRPLGPRGGCNGSKLSEAQIEWALRWKSSGGVYVVARCIEDLEELLLSLGKP